MNPELTLIANRLNQACTPEEVFGELREADFLQALRKIYRALAKVAHPDLYQARDEQLLAENAFSRLNAWLEQAEAKIRAGSYGQPVEAKTILQTKKRTYRVEPDYLETDLYNLYDCQYEEAGRTRAAVLKIVREPLENDFAQNEVRILNLLSAGADAARFAPYFPALVEAFVYDDGAAARQALVLEGADGWYSLAQVREAYPGGIDPKDMAWIWRRLLVALGYAHGNGVIHGAVLPENVWIQPEEHGLRLENWCYAVCDPQSSGERLAAIHLAYAGWYPEAVLKHEPPTPGLDLLFSARCMLWLLGADPRGGDLPASLPAPLKNFFRGCFLPARRSPQEAWTLLAEFDELLERLWGKRQFHPFRMK
jgi:serine/threonine protein kinase